MGASPEANKQLIRDYFEAVSTGASDKLAAAFSDDIEWWVPPSSPMAGTYKGRRPCSACSARACPCTHPSR